MKCIPIIVIVSEISKKSSLIGGILASIPLLSLLSFIWIYIETKEIEKIIDLSYSIFFLVIPSLLLFILLPVLLKNKINFYLSLLISSVVTSVFYFVMVRILKYFGVKSF
ncbi:MAG TPA: hypothetical protein DHW82_06130 [Spirochaetia bacterium]|nr:hypothetical protein [Spirochaetia bacterium]